MISLKDKGLMDLVGELVNQRELSSYDIAVLKEIRCRIMGSEETQSRAVENLSLPLRVKKALIAAGVTTESLLRTRFLEGSLIHGFRAIPMLGPKGLSHIAKLFNE